MLRNIPDLLNAARLEIDVGIDLPDHSLVDDILLMLLEQSDEPSLVADEFAEHEVLHIKESSYDLLLFLRGTNHRHAQKFIRT